MEIFFHSQNTSSYQIQKFRNFNELPNTNKLKIQPLYHHQIFCILFLNRFEIVTLNYKDICLKNYVPIEIWKSIAMSFQQNIESKRIFIICYCAQNLSPILIWKWRMFINFPLTSFCWKNWTRNSQIPIHSIQFFHTFEYTSCFIFNVKEV